MSEERSNKLRFHAHASAEKLDYFVCSVAGALFAYTGQNFSTKPFRFDSSLFEPIALCLLVASFICGFRRIELENDSKFKNADLLEATEHADVCTEMILSGGEGSVVIAGFEINDAAEAAKLRTRFQANAAQLDQRVGATLRRSEIAPAIFP